jgi:hypothetical protein
MALGASLNSKQFLNLKKVDSNLARKLGVFRRGQTIKIKIERGGNIF